MKEWLYWWTLGYAKRVRSDLLRANAWHHRSDAISSIVVLAGIAGTMAGLPYLDAIAAIMVALMIGQIAWELGWSAVNELVDTGLESDRLEAIRSTIRSVGGVRDIHMLRTRRHGGDASADVHILVDPVLSVSDGHMISLLVEQRLKREIDEITDVTVHIDPEDDDTIAPRTDLPLSAEVLARLASAWSGIPAATERQRVVLHYLAGQIDVEVYFPLTTCAGRGNDPSLLRQHLKQALAQAPEFRELRIYFEKPAPLWCFLGTAWAFKVRSANTGSRPLPRLSSSSLFARFPPLADSANWGALDPFTASIDHQGANDRAQSCFRRHLMILVCWPESCFTRMGLARPRGKCRNAFAQHRRNAPQELVFASVATDFALASVVARG